MKTKILILIIILTVAHLYAQEKGQDVFAPDYHTLDIIDQSIAGDEYGLQIDQSNYNSSVLGACRIDTIYEFTYENITSKVPLSREFFSFTPFNEIETGYKDKYVSGAWQPSSKITITYDSQNRRNEYLSYEWVNNAWVNAYKFNYFYDNLTYIQITQRWQSGTWVNWNRSTTTKNQAGQNIAHQVETWKNNTWQISWAISASYNSNNQLSTTNYQVGSNGVLVNSTKTTYQYDNDKLLILKEQYKWENNNYKLVKQTHYYYNQGIEDHNITSEASGSNLVVTSKGVNVYDNQLRLIATDYYNVENQNWVLAVRVTNEYNTNGDIIAYDNYSMWSPTANNFMTHYRTEYKCNLLSSSADLSLSSTFNIYPNPLSGDRVSILTYRPQHYLLFNMSGFLVQEGMLYHGDNQIDLPILDCGIYFIKVGTLIKKIVKI